MSAIYALTDSVGHIRYVGATVGLPQRRLTAHRSNARRRPRHVPAGFRSWLLSNRDIRIVVLESDPDDLGAAESYWIARSRSAGHALLNRAMGGRGNHGVRHTPEQSARYSEVRLGVRHGKVHRFVDPTKQVVSGARGAHNRWHRDRGLHNPSCEHCALSSS